MSHTVIDACLTCADAAVRVLSDYAVTQRPEFLEFLLPRQEDGHLVTSTGLQEAIRRLHDERLAVVERQGYGAKPPSTAALQVQVRWLDPARGVWLIVWM